MLQCLGKNRPRFPKNRQEVESRIRSSERNLKKKGFVEKEFQKVIDTYLEKGYLCQLPESEAPPMKFGTCRTFRLLN